MHPLRTRPPSPGRRPLVRTRGRRGRRLPAPSRFGSVGTRIGIPRRARDRPTSGRRHRADGRSSGRQAGVGGARPRRPGLGRWTRGPAYRGPLRTVRRRAADNGPATTRPDARPAWAAPARAVQASVDTRTGIPRPAPDATYPDNGPTTTGRRPLVRTPGRRGRRPPAPSRFGSVGTRIGMPRPAPDTTADDGPTTARPDSRTAWAAPVRAVPGGVGEHADRHTAARSRRRRYAASRCPRVGAVPSPVGCRARMR